MLRVLTLSTLFPDAARPTFGGFVARQTLGLAAHPAVDLRVVAPVGLPPFPLDHAGRFAAMRGLPLDDAWQGVPVLRPRFRTLPGTGGRFHIAGLMRALIPGLDRLRDDFAFDVIDAEFFFPDGPAAVALGRRYGVPVSIKARGSDIHFWGRAAPTGHQVIAAGRAADGLLAVSGAMRDDMIALGMPATRIAVHHTGVDLDRFTPAADRMAAKAALGVAGPLVVSVGTLNANKGQAIIIDAVARLPGVSLLMAGDGPDAAALAAQIATAGVGDRVRLLGSLGHDAIAALLAAGDVFALASAREGLANVWVEALASGTPVVITAAGGAREVVVDPAYGRIVARDPAAFAEAIAAVIDNPPPPATVRAGAQRFSWDANRDALFAHLSQLVAARGAQSAASSAAARSK